MHLKRSILITAFLAGACQVAPTPTSETGDGTESERLMRGCAEASRLLGQMKAAETSFRYDAAGNATISTTLWMAMPDQMKTGLVKAIAYHAVCEAEAPGEQQVTVRSAESSDILVQETVTDFDR